MFEVYLAGDSVEGLSFVLAGEVRSVYLILPAGSILLQPLYWEVAFGQPGGLYQVCNEGDESGT